jgi:hypothetical protein
MITRNKYIALLFILITSAIYSQKKDEIRIVVDSKFDIIQVAKEYLGNSDLWLYILKYNSVKNLSDLKPGQVIQIPQAQVKRVFSKLDEANNAIQNAVLLGAKVLAESILEEAAKNYQLAVKQKDSYEYQLSESSSLAAISLAQKAAKQTKEIREKTIDAIISFKKGTVQKLFPANPEWHDAEIYDNLKENDWARTLSLSLANITFYDLSQIKLNENSQAIIQSSRYDVIGNRTSTKVKLEKGDAYAMLLNNPKKKFDLDIKGVKTKINSKYFWVEKNNSKTKLSNYNGEISLQVKDSAVVVQKNQGSVIPDGGFPSTPQNLLSPPNLISPDNLLKLLELKPYFIWTKVEAAVNYWLEIATDPAFKKVVYLIKNIKTEAIQTSEFKSGVYYWHVCSVDNQGLPGPYTEYRTFVVSFDVNKPFLDLTQPGNNYATKEQKILVKGSTDLSCKIYINDKNVVPDQKGYFEKEIDLKDGKNSIVVRSVNNNGDESEITKNVFYESDSDIKISEKSFGTLLNDKIFSVNQSYLTLQLSIRPLSNIEIKSKQTEVVKNIYADTLGNCSVNLSISLVQEEFIMTIKTPAGYQKSISFKTVRNSNTPKINIDPAFQTATNQETFIIQGKVEEANEFYIDEEKIKLDSEKRFNSVRKLKRGDNIFTLKAIGEAGLITSVEKKVYYDNQPPKLISSSVQKQSGSQSLYKIIIKASDDTELKKTAEVELSSGNIRIVEVLAYNLRENLYEGSLNISSQEKPVLRKIILEDYLMNKKIYEVGK